MFRSYWKGTLAAALSLGGLAAWAQTQFPQAPISSTYGLQQMPVGPVVVESIRSAPMPMAGAQTLTPMPVSAAPVAVPGTAQSAERIITVQEPGKPPQQCRVVKETRNPDGNSTLEVVALDTGEKMTIVDGGSVLVNPDAYPTARIQGRVSRVMRPGQMVLPDGSIVVEGPTPVNGAPLAGGAAPVDGSAAPLEGQVAESGRFPLLRRIFGVDGGPAAATAANGGTSSPGAVSAGTGAGFDREKYLADLRAKYGNGQPNTGATAVPMTKPADTATAVNKPAATLPTVTPPPAPPTVAAKSPAKPAVESAAPSDWRKSWGKNESPQMAKADDKTKKDEKKKDDEPKPDVAKAKPEPKKDLPAAPPRSDPLWEPERFSKRPEVATEAAKAPSPLIGAGEVKPKVVAEVVPAVEAAGKASSYKVPLGGRSVLAAYDDVSNQVVYMPVPMVTVPPTAHMMPPPHPAQNLPPDINAAMVNAFTSGGNGPSAMPAGYQDAMAANAFPGGPMMTDPMPMGYPMMGPNGPMAMGPYGPMPMNAYGQMPMGNGPMPRLPQMGGYPAMPAMAASYPAAMPVPSYPSAVDPQVAQHLVQTLRDALYPSQREFAAEALAAIDWRTHPQVFDCLLTSAREDPAPTVRTTCVRCLAGMNINSSLMAMTFQALKSDGDPRVRNEVEQALAKLPAGKTVPTVQPASALMPAK